MKIIDNVMLWLRFRFSIAVWGIAIFGIVIMNDSYGIEDFEEWAFKDSTQSIYYLTHVSMFWINSR